MVGVLAEVAEPCGTWFALKCRGKKEMRRTGRLPFGPWSSLDPLLEFPWPWPCCQAQKPCSARASSAVCISFHAVMSRLSMSQCSLYSALVVQLAALKSFVWSVCAEVAGRGVGYTTPAADGQAAGLMAMLQLFWDLLFLCLFFLGCVSLYHIV